MRKSVVAIIMALAMALCFCAGCAALPQNTGNTIGSGEGDSQELSLLKSDAKISQEDMLSRIKADYLIKNGGYADGDLVTAVIELDSASLSDT